MIVVQLDGFFRGHYQNAYVTHDLARAEALLARTLGLKDFLHFEPDMIVETPNGPRRLQLSLSTAWSGFLQIELIQPIGGFTDFYRGMLPDDQDDFRPRFHHVAVRRPYREGLAQEFVDLGMPAVLEGRVQGLIFGYVDARHSVGHYIEYCGATDENWAYNGWPAGKPIL